MPLVVDSTGNDLTYKLIGLAMEVHNELGHGFKEEVYEKALEVKLNHAGLEPNRQFEVFVDFEGERVATFYLAGSISKPEGNCRDQGVQSPTEE